MIKWSKAKKGSKQWSQDARTNKLIKSFFLRIYFFLGVITVIGGMIIINIVTSETFYDELTIFALGIMIGIPMIISFIVLFLVFNFDMSFIKKQLFQTDPSKVSSFNSAGASKMFLYILVVFLLIIGLMSAIKVSNEKVKNQFQQLVAETFLQDGFKGKIVLSDIGKSLHHGIVARYEYTEKIGDQTISRTLSMRDLFESESDDVSKIRVAEKELVDVALERPEVTSELKKIKQRFRKIVGDDKCEVSMRVADISYVEYLHIVEENRQKGGAVGGYYDIDPMKLAREGIYQFKIEFNGENKSVWNESADKLSAADYQGLPDGEYICSHNLAPSYTDRTLLIKDGKLSSRSLY